MFILVFNFFNVPREVHHKVLFWGIIGAIVFRAIFIFSGIGIINLTYLPKMELMGKDVQINVVLTLFGAFLIYAGFKSWFVDEDDDDEKDFSAPALAQKSFDACLPSALSSMAISFLPFKTALSWPLRCW